MSVDIRDTARTLRSEKVTERKKGRKSCEDLLVEDRTSVTIPHGGTRPDGLAAELLKGVIRYEENEIKYARDKRKVVEIGVAQFVKKVMKHFMTASQRYLQVLVTTADNSKLPIIVVIIDWVLKNMRDKHHESNYREEHRGILCDLLDYRASHSLSRTPHILHNIYLYLADSMIDKASICSLVNQRIMRLLSRALFSDDESVSMVTNKFVEWFCSSNDGRGLFHYVSDDIKAEADLVVTIADCCAVLIEYHGINIAQLAFLHMKCPLQIVIRQLPQQQSRDSYKYPYLRFLLSFLDLSIRSSYSYSSPICDINPLAKSHGQVSFTMLESLCKVITNEDSFKALVVSVTNVISLRQNRNAYYNPMQEPKVRLYFDVVALAYFLQYAQALTHSKKSSEENDDSYDDSNKRQRLAKGSAANSYANNNSSSSSGSSKTRSPREDVASSTSKTMLVQLFTRLANFSLINKNSRSSTGGSGSSAPSHTQAGGGVRSASPLITDTMLDANSITSPILFESLLLILQALVHNFPRGEFLTSHEDVQTNFLSRVTRVHKLRNLVGILHEKLLEALPLHNLQVSGGLMVTLCGLARLTSVLCKQSYSSSVAADGGAHQDAHTISVLHIQNEWSAIMHLLLQKVYVEKFASSCKKNSVSECYVTLLNTIIETDVLEPTGKWAVRQRLWAELKLVRDPRLVESPIAIKLLGSMSCAAKQEIPPMLCQSLLAEVYERNHSNNLVQENNVHAQQPYAQTQTQHVVGFSKTRYFFESIPLEKVVGNYQIVLYIISWLECQLDVHSSGRMPLNSTLAMCDSFDYLLQSLLPAAASGKTSKKYGHIPSSGVGTGNMNNSNTKNINDIANNWNKSQFISHDTPLMHTSFGPETMGNGADFRLIYSPLGNSPWFDEYHPSEEEMNIRTATSDDDIFHFMGTNMKVDGSGSLQVDGILDTNLSSSSSSSSSLPLSALQELPSVDISEAERERDDERFLAQLEFSLKMLTPLRDALRTAEIIRSQCSEAGDGMAAWQIVSAILSSVYASIAIDADKKKEGRTSQCQQKLKELLLYASASFWSLVDVQIAVLRFRIGHLKWATTSEYLGIISNTVRRVSHLHVFSTKNQAGAYSEVAECRRTLSDELVELLKVIRDSALVGGDVSIGHDDMIDDDFGGDKRVSPAKGRQRGRVPVDFMDGEDDDEDPLTMLPNRSQGLTLSQTNQSSESDTVHSGSTLKLVFSVEKQQSFSSCSVIFMIASFDHDDVHSLLTILQERQSDNITSRGPQLARFGVRLENPTKASLLKGHPVDCSLWVGSDMQLVIARDLCSVYSINAVYHFFCSVHWDPEWGPLGYYKVLCIISELTSRSLFLLTSQNDDTRANILSNIVTMACAKDDTLDFFPQLYWRIRCMQLRCINNIMAIQIKFKDEPGYLTLNADQKVTIRLLFTRYFKHDSDVRVRLCAASCLPQILAFYNAKKADKIYAGLIDVDDLHLLASMKNDYSSSNNQSSSEVMIFDDDALYGQYDPLLDVSNAVAIARMGVSSPILLQPALLDLIRLCCTRIASYKCDTIELLEGAMTQGVDRSFHQDDERYVRIMSLGSSSGQLPCFVGVLYRLIIFMSCNLGYSTPELFLLEHMRWLLFNWISSIRWSLRSFPFELFLSFREHAQCIQTSTQEQSTESIRKQRSAYQRFLIEQRGVIIPILCQIKDKERRWHEISMFAEDAGYGSTDQGIGALLADSIISIHANFFLLLGVPEGVVGRFQNSVAINNIRNSAMSQDMDVVEQVVDYSREAMQYAHTMEEFFSHSTDIESAKACTYNYRSDLVLDLARLLTYKAAHEYEPVPHGESGKDKNLVLSSLKTSDVFYQSLDEVCKMFVEEELCSTDELPQGQYLPRNLLEECNISEILATLQSRLSETNCHRIQLAALNINNVIFTQVTDIFGAGHLSSFRAVLSIITTVARKAMGPLVLEEVCNNLCQLAINFIESIGNGKSNPKAKSTIRKNISHFETVLLELFACLTTFLHVLQFCRYQAYYHEDDNDDIEKILPGGRWKGNNRRRSSSGDNSDLQVSMDLLVDAPFNQGLNGTSFEIDEFATSWYDCIIQRILADSSTPGLESASRWRLTINKCIYNMCGCVNTIYEVYNSDESDLLSMATIVPLPPTFIQSLSTIRSSSAKSSQSFSLSEEASHYFVYATAGLSFTSCDDKPSSIPAIEKKAKIFVDMASSALRGDPVPLPTIWIRLLNLSHQFGASSSNLTFSAPKVSEGGIVYEPNHEQSVWLNDTDLIGSLVSCLLRICTLRCAPTNALQNKVMNFLGNIGTPDLLTLSHTSLPSRLGDSLVASAYKVHPLKTLIFNHVCGMLWEDSQGQRAASLALRKWSQSKCLQDAHMESYASKVGPSCEQLLNAYAAPHFISLNTNHLQGMNYSLGGKNGDREAWDSRSIWSTSGKTFSSWVSTLTAHILLAFWGPGGMLCPIQEDSSASRKRSQAGRSKKSSSSKDEEGGIDRPTSKNGAFLMPLYDICLLRPEIAQAVLPLALFDIVTSIPETSPVLSHILNKYLLASRCSVLEATRLACSIIIFFLRQNILDHQMLTRANQIESGSENGANRISFALKVDLSYAAKAAARCGCVCSALQFAELSRETLDKHSSIGKILESREDASLTNKQQLSQQKEDIVKILMQVFKSIHDPDALLGMLVEGNELDVQALVYAHTGQWVASLSTYESIMQGNSRSSIANLHSQLGMAQALRGLGAQHMLTAYANSCRTSSVPDRDRQEIFGLASEASWRNRKLTTDREFLNSSGNGGFEDAASMAYNSNLQTIASLADDSLRGWSQLDSSANLHDSEAQGAMSYAGFFNSSIASALQDMSRGDYCMAIQRSQQCTSVLMPHIFEVRSQESASSLIPSIVCVQQLFEVQEVSKILQHNAHVGSDRKSVDSLMQHWGVRLGTSSGSSSSASNESILSLRLSLASVLLEKQAAQPGQVLRLMDQVYTCIPKNSSSSAQAITHSVSPLAYRIHATIKSMTNSSRVRKSLSSHSLPSSVDCTEATEQSEVLLTEPFPLRAWKPEWKLHEARLLWKKGLDKVAIRQLDHEVIGTLREDFNFSSAGAHSKMNPAAKKKKDECTHQISNMLSKALRQGGEWMSSKRAATGVEISEKYLAPAVQYAVGTKERINAQSSLAAFNDKMHLSAKARVESEEHRHLDKMNKSRTTEYEICCNMIQKLSKAEKEKEENVNLRRHIKVLKKEIEADTKELRYAEESVNKYLIESLWGYAQVLELSEENDQDIVFRVINLWLNNRRVPEVNEVMSGVIERTRTYKFIPLSYQILSLVGSTSGIVEDSQTGSASSIGGYSKGSDESTKAQWANRTTDFGTNISVLVSKMAADHPYHVLPLLFALVNGDNYGPGSGKKIAVMTNRITVAEGILEELKLQNRSTDNTTSMPSSLHLQQAKKDLVSSLVLSLEVVLRAYINLANTPVDAWIKARKTSGIKFNEFQQRGNRFDRCLEHVKQKPHLITLTPTLQKDANYAAASVICIHKFVDEFSITETGLSRPKILKVIGSDGREYKELAKANDDMRQDAVMEQVFENVNTTLLQDTETRKRRLRMRTYKCVPMTPQSGVIQWVENARPFADFLTNNNTGAHARYYPEDWTHYECRQHLANADSGEKERRLLEIYQKFHPAFRYIFLEQYADPAQWLSCRLAYTRSVAVASMIGYILAIGDRHAQNVMIDVSTAEVIHIDFGIVFDQGKALPTPETVPFRLTRDVVDGMGITGVEGTFRKSCEEVMRTLRTNSAQILTILEVVIHDPLYKWSLSPVEARNKQTRPSSRADVDVAPTGVGVINVENADTLQTNLPSESMPSVGRDAAERTLMRIRNKLRGYEDATGEGLGVEGQVEQLLAQAQDTKNLSRLFVGWAPWL